MFLSDKEPVRSHSEKVLRQEEVGPEEHDEVQDGVKEVHKKRRTITELQPAVIDDVSNTFLILLKFNRKLKHLAWITFLLVD